MKYAKKSGFDAESVNVLDSIIHSIHKFILLDKFMLRNTLS